MPAMGNIIGIFWFKMAYCVVALLLLLLKTMEAVGSIIITLGANGLGFPWETLVEVLILLLLCDVVFVDKGLLECHPKAAPASKNRVTLSHICFV